MEPSPTSPSRRTSTKGRKCESGCGCGRHSSETRARISAGKRGKPNPHPGRKKSEDERRRISEALKGREKSPETREKLRQANLGKVSPRRGVPRSTEVKAKIAASKLGHEVAIETRRKIGKTLRQAGFHLDRKGYIVLSGQHDHPLATSRGLLREHRKVLYDAIGPGEHSCHWCDGPVRWEDGTLAPDHLDWNPANNARDNLVQSCYPCNSARQNPRGRWVLLPLDHGVL